MIKSIIVFIFLGCYGHSLAQLSGQKEKDILSDKYWRIIEYGKYSNKLKTSWKNNSMSIVNSHNVLEFKFSNVYESIQLLKKFSFDDSRQERIQVDLGVWCTDTALLKGVRFIALNEDGSKELFRFTGPIKSLIDANEWNDLTFSFVTHSLFDDIFFGIEMIHSGQLSGDLKIRNLGINKVGEISSNGLIRNGDFENHYYFPVGDNELFVNSTPFWNEAKNNGFYQNDNFIARVNTSNHISLIQLVSDYHEKYSKLLSFHNGHFAAEITNEYVYDSIIVPLNRSINSIYLQTQLNERLKKGKQYVLSFDLMLSPYSSKADNFFGAKFTDSLYYPDKDVDLNSPDRIIPQPDLVFFQEPLMNDTTWTRISILYTACGGESFLTFGCFENRPHIQTTNPSAKELSSNHITSTYFIDNISLIEKVTK